MMSTPLCPLVVFYDCETIGLDICSDRIIEIAATVDSSVEALVKEPKTFESLIFTSQKIHPGGMNWLTRTITQLSEMYSEASFVSGISNKDLEGEKPFPEVLRRFLTWLQSKCAEASIATSGTSHYPGTPR